MIRAFFNFLLVLIFLFCAIGFNVGLVDLRIDEINYLLGKQALHQDATNTLGIVGKYELIRQRMERGEADQANYELEAKVVALASSKEQMEKEESLKEKLYRTPITLVVNVLRFALGKEIINPTEEDKIFNVLEIGYFWERNRKYTEALKIYNEVMDKTDHIPEVKSAVMLHKAFCHSMLGEYKNSQLTYERVINLYPNTEAGVISWKLLDFIQSMEKERETLDRKRMSHFEKAKRFYMLMDYRNAIKHFSMFMDTRPPERMMAEALYYKGRSHEEIGETKKAIDEYYKVMRRKNQKQWARNANRRMLMLGEFYEQRKQIASEARKQLAAYQDSNFIKKVGQFSKMVSTSSLRSELLASVEEKKAESGGNDSIFALINEIGELDLTGEKEKRKEMERRRRQLIKEGKLSRAEVKELEKQVMLAANKYRRPSAIKDVIDDNASQLRYLYNRRLRKGINLSGKMLVEMNISPNGRVAGARVMMSDIGDPGFEEEVLGKIQTWRFKPVADSLGALTVKYPFEFYKEEG